MKKASIWLSTFFIVSLLLVIIKTSSPFGWIFWFSLNGCILSFVSLVTLFGIYVWKKRGRVRWAGAFLLFISTAIGTLVLVVNLDYRAILPITSAMELNQNEWEEDIEFLKSKLKTHPAYNDSLDLIINDRLTSFKRGIEDLTRDEKLLEITRLVALFEDGHSFVPPFQIYNRSRYFPVNGFYFDDGYYILKASSEYQVLVNKKVTRFGNQSVEEVFNNIKQQTGPENLSNAKYRFDFYIYSSNFLRSLDIIDGEKLSIAYLDGGQEKELEVKSAPFLNWMFWTLKPTQERLPISVNLKTPNFQLYREDSSLHLQFNLIENNSNDDTIEQLAEELDNTLGEQGVEKLIIDLRNNTGGNNYLYDSIINTIKKHTYINDGSRLFVLTSRTTFSAGINFLDDLNFHTNATLVGEPVGAGPTHYGDANIVTLPNSGIYFFLSTKQWKGNIEADTSRTIQPDIRILFRFQDYADNTDPWMMAIN